MRPLLALLQADLKSSGSAGCGRLASSLQMSAAVLVMAGKNPLMGRAPATRGFDDD